MRKAPLRRTIDACEVGRAALLLASDYTTAITGEVLLSMRGSTSRAWCFTEEPAEERAMKVADPVCGVQVDTEKAVAQEDYGSRTFFFCSVECHRLFKTSPERYTRIDPGSTTEPDGNQP